MNLYFNLLIIFTPLKVSLQAMNYQAGTVESAQGVEAHRRCISDRLSELLGNQSFENLSVMAGMVAWNNYGTVCGFIKPEKNGDLYTYALHRAQLKENALIHYSFPITTLKTGWGVVHTFSNNTITAEKAHGETKVHLDFPRPTLDGCVAIGGPQFETTADTLWVGVSYQDGSYKKYSINNAGTCSTEVCVPGHKRSCLEGKPDYTGGDITDSSFASKQPADLQKRADELIARWMGGAPRQ